MHSKKETDSNHLRKISMRTQTNGDNVKEIKYYKQGEDHQLIEIEKDEYDELSLHASIEPKPITKKNTSVELQDFSGEEK